MAVASRGSGPADQERRAEWLALAGRAVRADKAARAQRQARLKLKDQDGRATGPDRMTGRTALMEQAIGARNLARVEASTRTRPAVRAGTRPAARTAVRTAERTAELARPRSAAGYVVLLVAGSLYGLAMAALTAVAVARFATTEPLGAVGPVAFIGVAIGFLTLAAIILPSVRSRRD